MNDYYNSITPADRAEILKSLLSGDKWEYRPDRLDCNGYTSWVCYDKSCEQCEKPWEPLTITNPFFAMRQNWLYRKVKE